MSDFLQRLVSRHLGAASRVLPNANRFMSRGAELGPAAPEGSASDQQALDASSPGESAAGEVAREGPASFQDASAARLRGESAGTGSAPLRSASSSSRLEAASSVALSASGAELKNAAEIAQVFAALVPPAASASSAAAEASAAAGPGSGSQDVSHRRTRARSAAMLDAELEQPTAASVAAGQPIGPSNAGTSAPGSMQRFETAPQARAERTRLHAAQSAHVAVSELERPTDLAPPSMPSFELRRPDAHAPLNGRLPYPLSLDAEADDRSAPLQSGTTVLPAAAASASPRLASQPAGLGTGPVRVDHIPHSTRSAPPALGPLQSGEIAGASQPGTESALKPASRTAAQTRGFSTQQRSWPVPERPGRRGERQSVPASEVAAEHAAGEDLAPARRGPADTGAKTATIDSGAEPRGASRSPSSSDMNHAQRLSSSSPPVLRADPSVANAGGVSPAIVRSHQSTASPRAVREADPASAGRAPAAARAQPPRGDAPAAAGTARAASESTAGLDVAARSVVAREQAAQLRAAVPGSRLPATRAPASTPATSAAQPRPQAPPLVSFDERQAASRLPSPVREQSAAPPHLTVTIGTVELHAAPPLQQSEIAMPRATPRVSLDQYLRRGVERT